MKIVKQTVLLASIFGALAGCVASPTWVNHGHGTVNVDSDRIHCFTDAAMIHGIKDEGVRVEGELCAVRSTGFRGDGEPELRFGPWGRRLIQASATESLSGVEREWRGAIFNLQCEKILSEATGNDVGRNCKVTVNNQHLMSASYLFTPK